jgi:YidC/Oxa1 family membrane protein insertase
MEMMKYMPYIFPVMLMGLFNSFPAALTYYYFLQNIISYGQQWAIKKWFIDEAALHKHIQDNKKKPVKKSMFQQRLEDMSKQQQKGRGKK